jgi:hypothetical protein
MDRDGLWARIMARFYDRTLEVSERVIEHVRSDSERLARWQDRLMRPWRRVALGCQCNRRTVDLLRAHGLQLVELRHEQWHRAPRLIRPLVVGRARRPDHA